MFDNVRCGLKTRVPDHAVLSDPFHLFFEATRADLAGPHAPDLRGGDESGLLQNADVLLHARESHVELDGEVGDRRVCTRELLENAASGGV